MLLIFLLPYEFLCLSDKNKNHRYKIIEFYKFFHQCLKLFPKQEKYTLGQKIENVILEILELVLLAAYTTKNKKEILVKANNKIDLLKYLVRLAYETESINVKKYSLLEEKVIEIGKMIGGWQKM